MAPNLQAVELAILGGDARELVLLDSLGRCGAVTKVFGLPVKDGRGVSCSSPIAAVTGVRAVILPVPGVIDEEGRLFGTYLARPLFVDDDLVVRFPPDAPVLVGKARPYLRDLLGRHGLRLVELMELPEMAVLNSIPSAEGAIQMAMERLPVTIHGSRAYVLGYGRTGITLARMLLGIGAKTVVSARNPAQLARAFEAGHGTVPLAVLGDFIGDADVVFNTVPALVLSGDLLSRLKARTVIIDLASAPGGTDFGCADALGLPALLAPALPGRVAPQTAGEILAKAVLETLARELAL
ncbi:MAG: dipicolinate synthase subunit DpsA [Peptococcaceae bacterium]|jgi:dipicolinate synthase subunit A|nr:dipicolinate synthase subunit DpsA [Peptococcaceae bacterium]